MSHTRAVLCWSDGTGALYRIREWGDSSPGELTGMRAELLGASSVPAVLPAPRHQGAPCRPSCRVRPPRLPVSWAGGVSPAAARDERPGGTSLALPRVLSAIFYWTCSFFIALVNKGLLSAYSEERLSRNLGCCLPSAWPSPLRVPAAYCVPDGSGR